LGRQRDPPGRMARARRAGQIPHPPRRGSAPEERVRGNVLGTAVHGAIHAGHKSGLAMILLIVPAMKVTDLWPQIQWALDELDPKIVDGLSKAANAPAKPLRSSALWKPLMDAAFRGDAATVRKLLAAGVDPNVVSSTAHRYRPLNRAIERKKLT